MHLGRQEVAVRARARAARLQGVRRVRDLRARARAALLQGLRRVRDLRARAPAEQVQELRCQCAKDWDSGEAQGTSEGEHGMSATTPGRAEQPRLTGSRLKSKRRFG